MQSQFFSKKPSNIVFNKKGLTFEFSINKESFNNDFDFNNLKFNLKVANQTINGCLEHLIQVKDYILKQDVNMEIDNMLVCVSEFVKSLKY